MWMDSWPREVRFISPWVSASKTAAMDHCLTHNNDGSRRKECGTVIETAVPGAVRQAASNCKLWEPCLVVLSMLFVSLYINGCVQLLNGLATRNHTGVWPRPSPHLGWILLSRGSRTCCLTIIGARIAKEPRRKIKHGPWSKIEHGPWSNIGQQRNLGVRRSRGSGGRRLVLDTQ